MATCMLCSTWVLDGETVCPHCGGATDATRVQDATSADAAAPWDAPPPAAPPPAWEAPPAASGGPFGPRAPAPPPGGYAPPGASGPPAHGGPGGYGPPAYAAPGYGAPGYAAPGYAAPGYPGAGYGVPYGAPYGGGWVPPVPTNGMAVTSLVVSVVALVATPVCYLPILAAPVGAILGHLAMRRIGETGEKGRGLALAGAIVGWVGTALLLLGIALVVALAASA